LLKAEKRTDLELLLSVRLHYSRQKNINVADIDEIFFFFRCPQISNFLTIGKKHHLFKGFAEEIRNIGTRSTQNAALRFNQTLASVEFN